MPHISHTVTHLTHWLITDSQFTHHYILHTLSHLKAPSHTLTYLTDSESEEEGESSKVTLSYKSDRTAASTDSNDQGATRQLETEETVRIALSHYHTLHTVTPSHITHSHSVTPS